MSTTVQFTNYSILVGKKYDSDWWDWCIFADETPDDIMQIRAVEYTLHETFPDPVRTVTDKDQKFALFSSGWGQFTIKIKIEFENGEASHQTHFVKFSENNWPVKSAPAQFDSEAEGMVYRDIESGSSRWRKTGTIIKYTNLPEDQIMGALKSLEGEQLVRKSPFKTIDNSDMWGVTALVGCQP